jgi:Tfp pilus assembly protein PilV
VKREAGFSLTEILVATVLTTVGVLGAAPLMVYGTNLQYSSRDGSLAVNLAVAELERIRMLPVWAPERQNGGSLTANVANHFRIDGDVTMRWVIANGPACGPPTWAPATIECSHTISVVATHRNLRARRGRVDGMVPR